MSHVTVIGGSAGGGGVPGPPGAPGFGATYTGTAGEPLSADKLVYLAADGLVYTADCTTTPQDTLIGFTQTAALLGAAVVIARIGLINIGGGLVAGTRYFLGTAGGVTAAPVGPGLFQQVGVAESATELMAAIMPAIVGL